MIRVLFVFIICIVTIPADAQQMIVVKRGHIQARFNLGDPIRYVSKDGETHNAAILHIREFEFITLQRDTVKFSDVTRLKFKNKQSWAFIKGTLIGSAGLLALHFALKEPYGDKNPQAVKGLAYAAGSGLLPVILLSLIHI